MAHYRSEGDIPAKRHTQHRQPEQGHRGGTYFYDGGMLKSI